MHLTFNDTEEYRKLDEELDLLMVRAKEINDKLNVLDEKIISAAEWNGQYDFKIPENGSFKVTVNNHFRILKQDKPKLIEEWKEDETLKVFVKEDIHASRIKSHFKEFYKQNGNVPEIIAMFPEIVVKYKPTRKHLSKKKYKEDEEGTD